MDVQTLLFAQFYQWSGNDLLPGTFASLYMSADIGGRMYGLDNTAGAGWVVRSTRGGGAVDLARCIVVGESRTVYLSVLRLNGLSNKDDHTSAGNN